ncbi:MAG: S41 family peptidase [Candidatus Wallbacteria bacterium]|nr:S41 family peptidase [Candidatus Wallbacteria bacterium]
MFKLFSFFLIILTTLISAEVPQLTKMQKSMDFNNLVTLINTNYGMLAFKKANIIQTDYKEWVKSYYFKVNATKSDAEYYNTVREFISYYKDAHFSIDSLFNKTVYFLQPDFQYIQGKVLLSKKNNSPATFTAAIGDELLEFDGIPINDYLTSLSHQSSCGGTAVAIKGAVAPYLTFRLQGALPPQTETSKLKIKSFSDGTEKTYELKWEATIWDNIYRRLPEQAVCSLADWLEWRPDRLMVPAALYQHLKEEITGDLASARAPALTYEIITVPLGIKNYKIGHIWIRQYGGWTSSQFSTMVQSLAECDGLLIDQRNNPGGSGGLMFSVVMNLADKDFQNSVFSVRLNRKWLSSIQDQYEGYLNDSTATTEEIATIKGYYDTMFKNVADGKAFSDFMPLFWVPTLPAAGQSFKKPILFMINSQCYSCGDITPAILQDNCKGQRIKIYGETTAGAGGNVNSYGPLMLSELNISLTESIIRRADGTFIENSGISPDVKDEYTRADLVSSSQGTDSYSTRALTQLMRMIVGGKESE